MARRKINITIGLYLIIAGVLFLLQCTNPLLDKIKDNVYVATHDYAPEIALYQGNSEITSDFTFGNVNADASRTLTFIIRNTGDQDLTLNGNPLVDIRGEDSKYFTVKQPAGIVSPESEVSFELTFTPVETGRRRADMVILSNAENSTTLHINLSGSGVLSVFEVYTEEGNLLEEDDRDFIAHYPSAEREYTRHYTLRNISSEELPITAFGFTGGDIADFSLSHTVSSLPPMEDFSFSITFNPQSTGFKTAGISIESSAPGAGSFHYSVNGSAGKWRRKAIQTNTAGAEFGAAVDIYGDVVLAGCGLRFFRTFGGVHVLNRNEGGPDNWGYYQTQPPLPSPPYSGTINSHIGFGSALVLLDEEHALISAPDFTAGTDASPVYGSGIIYDMYWLLDFWSLNPVVTGDDGTASAGDQFGYSIAYDNLHSVAGLPGDDSGRGAVYFYDHYAGGSLDPNTERKLIQADTDDNAQFGYAVGIHGTYAIVGAPYDASDYSNSGAAYMYMYSNGNWVQQGAPLSPATDVLSNSAYFGNAVAICDNYCIVGAPEQDYDGNRNGAAYIFHRNGDTWEEVSRVDNQGYPYLNCSFGWSVAISEKFAVVGANRIMNSPGKYPGAVYIFENRGESWELMDVLYPELQYEYDYTLFGFSIAMEGDRLVVGAPYQDLTSQPDDNSGAVYVYYCELSGE